MRALILLWLDQRLFGAGVSINTDILNLAVVILSTKATAVFVAHKQLFRDFGKWLPYKLLKLMNSYKQV